MRYLEPIAETSYLSAVNAAQYRKIMRIFFLEYEKMHFQLYKEDVLEKLRAEAGYESYSIDQLKLDLEALVNWKNVGWRKTCFRKHLPLILSTMFVPGVLRVWFAAMKKPSGMY